MQLSFLGALLLTTGSFVSAATTTTSATKTSEVLAIESPAWLPDFPVPEGVNSGYPTAPLNMSSTLPRKTLDLKQYPEPWAAPDVKHAEVQKVIKAIDWSKVPKAPVRKTNKNGDIVFTGYDEGKDPHCWWSDTGCTKPKLDYIPEDVHHCPNPGDWGLNYDDGPYNLQGEDKEFDKWAEPELYNFLAKHNNQKATLFYIGSNVVTYPEAAKRALNHGHVLCSHTWSHPVMTTQTNEQVVAQLYWSLKAIKEATGVTTKCWRPPQGDVDDRVRAIAWQMGLHTYLWSEDTDDWNIKEAINGGSISNAEVSSRFDTWIKNQKAGKYKNGLIVLEHELNNATVKMTEKWLPKLQETFNVKSIHQCLNISQPYWETNWVYPIGNEALPANSTTNNTSVANNATTTTDAATTSTTDIVLNFGPTTEAAAAAATTEVAAAATTDAAASAANAANAMANSEIQQSAALSLKNTQSVTLLAMAAVAAYIF
ncbi:uncharacterized protein B0P05DRAFT_475337 [Gilbertella persicaria]|uniref:uncharacterized protein n=1 Tax=Gilbertella persicaria TaxID=101096 RepID=UPI002220B30B|nr:uncharacterized protein B0P05DRAFT_475337 [Gilbertella persicaria]KAI8067632.1 hypothetical protein B0P05DRAFT_475337 [Gilbertella persicaria]